MDWGIILTAILLIGMLVFIVPRVKPMLENSRKGSANEWLLVGGLLAGVAVFVWFLMQIV